MCNDVSYLFTQRGEKLSISKAIGKQIQFNVSKIQCFINLHCFAVNNKHSWFEALWKTDKTSWKDFPNVLGRSVPWFNSPTVVITTVLTVENLAFILAFTWLDQDSALSTVLWLCSGQWGSVRGISHKFHQEIQFLNVYGPVSCSSSVTDLVRSVSWNELGQVIMIISLETASGCDRLHAAQVHMLLSSPVAGKEMWTPKCSINLAFCTVFFLDFVSLMKRDWEDEWFANYIEISCRLARASDQRSIFVNR